MIYCSDLPKLKPSNFKKADISSEQISTTSNRDELISMNYCIFCNVAIDFWLPCLRTTVAFRHVECSAVIVITKKITLVT